MSNNQVVFYVSVDNNLRCVYYLSKKELDSQIISSDNIIELSGVVQPNRNNIEDKNITLDMKKTITDVFSTNMDQVIKGRRVWPENIHVKQTPRNIFHAGGEKLEDIPSESKDVVSNHPINVLHIPFLFLLIKPFVRELEVSSCYRKGTYNNLKKTLKQNNIKLFDQPSTDVRLVLEVFSKDSYQIDYAWGHRMWRQIRLSIERECAAAWLSTLGGAYSALGEQSDRCAKMALKISLQQIKLSADSGDADGIARGWLFMALGLSQLGHSNAAFHLLSMAQATPSYDFKHKPMCKGVEVKLKYDRKVRKQRKAKGILESPESLERLLKAVLL